MIEDKKCQPYQEEYILQINNLALLKPKYPFDFRLVFYEQQSDSEYQGPLIKAQTYKCQSEFPWIFQFSSPIICIHFVQYCKQGRILLSSSTLSLQIDKNGHQILMFSNRNRQELALIKYSVKINKNSMKQSDNSKITQIQQKQGQMENQEQKKPGYTQYDQNMSIYLRQIRKSLENLAKHENDKLKSSSVFGGQQSQNQSITNSHSPQFKNNESELDKTLKISPHQKKACLSKGLKNQNTKSFDLNDLTIEHIKTSGQSKLPLAWNISINLSKDQQLQIMASFNNKQISQDNSYLGSSKNLCQKQDKGQKQDVNIQLQKQSIRIPGKIFPNKIPQQFLSNSHSQNQKIAQRNRKYFIQKLNQKKAQKIKQDDHNQAISLSAYQLNNNKQKIRSSQLPAIYTPKNQKNYKTFRRISTGKRSIAKSQRINNNYSERLVNFKISNISVKLNNDADIFLSRFVIIYVKDYSDYRTGSIILSKKLNWRVQDFVFQGIPIQSELIVKICIDAQNNGMEIQGKTSINVVLLTLSGKTNSVNLYHDEIWDFTKNEIGQLILSYENLNQSEQPKRRNSRKLITQQIYGKNHQLSPLSSSNQKLKKHRINSFTHDRQRKILKSNKKKISIQNKYKNSWNNNPKTKPIQKSNIDISY